jgi:enoyl-CoA hydratase/carnithine racemase
MTDVISMEQFVGLLIADELDALATPVVVIDLDLGQEPEHLAHMADTAVGAPRVTIGIARSATVIDPTPFDLLICGQSEPPSPWVSSHDLIASDDPSEPVDLLARIVEEIRASPAAAIALVQLLRSGADLAVGDAVVAESWVYSLLQNGSCYSQWLEQRRRPRSRPAPSGDVIELRREGSIFAITLDRPEVRNAFSAQLRDELVAALELVRLDPSIERVELRGRGRAFSSGGDLDEFGTAPDPITAHAIRTWRNVGLGLARHAGRITSFVHGTCVGAGVELPAFTHEVIAHSGTTFRLPEVAMGLVPGAGGTASIPRRIGRHRTAMLALSGELINAPTALRWGLIDRIDDAAFSEDRP